jgi:hypothetical protein
MFKYLSLIAIVLVSYSFTGRTVKLPNTEYYFFELEPLKADAPYYFSQVITVRYNDINDLAKMKHIWFQELKLEVLDDKIDTSNYNEYVSPASVSREHCENIEIKAQTDITASGKKFISRPIKE